MEKITKTGSTFIPKRRVKGHDEFLLQLRDDGKGRPIPNPNKWSFGGGEMESRDKDYLACAIRECKEEFKIILKRKNCKLIRKYNHNHRHGGNLYQSKDDHVYLCNVKNSQRAVHNGEGAGLAWFDLKRLKQITKELVPYQRILIENLEED